MTIWTQNNSKVVTWVLNSIESNIALSLQSFSEVSDIWNHLKNLYHQANMTRNFFLDTHLPKYTQGDRTVQDYYNGCVTSLNELDSMVLSDVSS